MHSFFTKEDADLERDLFERAPVPTAYMKSGIIMLRFMQISSLLMGVSLVTICVCQAVGNAAGALALSISRQGVLFFVTITVLTTWIGFKGILLAQPLSDLLTGILAIIIISGILRKMDPQNIA